MVLNQTITNFSLKRTEQLNWTEMLIINWTDCFNSISKLLVMVLFFLFDSVYFCGLVFLAFFSSLLKTSPFKFNEFFKILIYIIVCFSILNFDQLKCFMPSILQSRPKWDFLWLFIVSPFAKWKGSKVAFILLYMLKIYFSQIRLQ
jgi:hypothetical protein